MTDVPYTDADLRAEAARQHAEAAAHLDEDRVGQQMCGAPIASKSEQAEGAQWDDEVLAEAEFDEAEQKIYALIKGAADVSEWAIQLGAAGLTPQPAMAWQSTTGGYDVAVQVATTRDLTDASREQLLSEIRKAVGETVCRVLGLKPVA